MTTLYDAPQLYDLIVPPGPCEAFYSAVARDSGGSVLELACGSGRLTVPLARAGCEVIGLDAARPMLEAARRKAAGARLQLPLVEGDLRSFDLGRRFDLVIVSCNSLAHLTTNADLAACLDRIRRHLAPGGRLAFDIVNPDIRYLAAARTSPGKLCHAACEGHVVAVEDVAPYDPVAQLRTMCWEVQRDGLPPRRFPPVRLRQIYPQELPLHLACAGLRLVARYGDFDRNPLTPSSPNQICIASTQ